jgi:hypothetical protein
MAAYDAAVAQAEAVVEADYTAATYAALQTALEENVVTEDNTQAEVDAATAAINAAIDALVEVADMAAYDAAVAQAEAVVEADYTAATYAALQTALEENVVTEDNTQEEVDAATAAINAAYDALELIVNVTGVSATDAKTLTVTFNTPVSITDQAAATITVKRGTTTIALDKTWAEDGLSVKLVRTANLQAGTYTATVTGIDLGTNSATTTVEAQKVASIEFVGNELVKNTGGSAGTFRYVVKDQYGTDFTTSVPDSAFTKSVIIGSTNLSSATTLTPSTKTGTISHTFVATDTIATVTLVNNATGVSKTAQLTVSASVKVADLTFGEPVLPTNKTRIETGLSTAATIPVTAMDQYGNEITSASVLSASMNLIPSNTNLAYSFVEQDNKIVMLMDTSAYTFTGTSADVFVTALDKVSGATFTDNFTVYKAVEPYTIELGDVSQETLAAGDTNIALDITVNDQFGTQMTAAQIASNATTINAGLASSNASFVTNPAIDTNSKSATYGKALFNTPGEGTAIITAQLTGGLTSKTLKVEAARAVSSLTNLTAVNMTQGASTDVKFAFSDQYGQLIPREGARTLVGDNFNNAQLKYEVTLTKVSGDDGAVTTSFTPLTATGDQSALDKINVTAAGNKTGTYKLTVNLLDKDTNAVVSTGYVNITVVKNNASGLTYNVTDVPVLAGDTTYNATSPYAAKVDVTATDSSGNSYVINPADIISVTSSNTLVADAGASSGIWYVFGADISGATAPATQTATITVQINTLDGFKTVTKDVTVAKAAPQIQTIRVLDAAASLPTTPVDVQAAIAGTGYRAATLPSSVTDTLNFVFATKASTTPIYVVGKDQYGVWTAPTANVVVNSTNLAPFNSLEITGANLGIAAAQAAAFTPQTNITATVTSGLGSQQIVTSVTAANTFDLTKDSDSSILLTTNSGIDLSGANGDVADIISAKTAAVTTITGFTITADKDFDTDGTAVTLTFDSSTNKFALAVAGSPSAGTAGDVVVTITHDATGLTDTITLTQGADGTVVVK